ncbi:hypothetical protein L228DRAFT_227812 [Xylona heveae TC161]|uniref:Pre-mRNA-splicing factor 18 n=1 Tax=Xylona heveae (strain CBS 132557 / TC161) TaxID=1328760 RepID=A0A165HV41_XYLHT|nr:hypothetical protein L228DRAFT_227812 [Xylona heveae TC161]KZF23961.1 hypothetical protein L228DRAFT_227812 [Xylona heveae TC161]
MDFKALMSREIAKSQPSKDTSTSSSSSNNKAYVKRADLEAERLAKYQAEQEAIAAAKEERAQKKRKLEEEEATRNAAREEKRKRLAEESRKRREEEAEREERARRKRLGLPERPSSETPTGTSSADGTPLPEDEDIPDDELVSKLRELSEPVTLFGESHKQRVRRYRRLTAAAKSREASSTPQPGGLTSADLPIPTTLILVPEKEMKVPALPPKDDKAREYLYRQLASYFTMVLREWAAALANRPESVRQSFQGKAAFNAMLQARENMRPLFRNFEKSDLKDDLLKPIVEIVHAAQERRYVDANDGYLRLSIGKAAWPIGVTQVGIHARSAREKINEGTGESQAHIMSDEATRKMLQSIKRCLSFAQTRWPPEDQLQLMG